MDLTRLKKRFFLRFKLSPEPMLVDILVLRHKAKYSTVWIRLQLFAHARSNTNKRERVKHFPDFWLQKKSASLSKKIRNFSVFSMSELNNLISITVVVAAARRVHEQGYNYHRAESYRNRNL